MSLWVRLTSPVPDRSPPVLRLPALKKAPEAPLGVVVKMRGFGSRNYYLPAFRSDHPVWFLAPGEELRSWTESQSQGFVLVRKADGPLRGYADLTLQGRSKEWLVYRRAAP